MPSERPLPAAVPAIGFYYHYKHEPEKGVRHYAYLVLGVGWHTETEEITVTYCPLYEEASVFQASKKLGVPSFDNRPIEMWMGNAEVGGSQVRRFTKIEDAAVIDELRGIFLGMYRIGVT